MALTLAQFRSTYGGTAALPDGRIQRALDGAAALVARQHGPEAPEAGMLLRCTWDLAFRYEWFLDAGRQMAAVVRVEMAGTELPPERWRFRGRTLSASLTPFWNEVTADFEPALDTAAREAMVGDLAALRLKLPNAPEGGEGRVLRRLALTGAAYALPESIVAVPAAAPGGG